MAPTRNCCPCQGYSTRRGCHSCRLRLCRRLLCHCSRRCLLRYRSNRARLSSCRSSAITAFVVPEAVHVAVVLVAAPRAAPRAAAATAAPHRCHFRRRRCWLRSCRMCIRRCRRHLPRYRGCRHRCRRRCSRSSFPRRPRCGRPPAAPRAFSAAAETARWPDRYLLQAPCALCLALLGLLVSALFFTFGLFSPPLAVRRVNSSGPRFSGARVSTTHARPPSRVLPKNSGAWVCGDEEPKKCETQCARGLEQISIWPSRRFSSGGKGA